MLSILLLIGATSPWLLTGPSRPAALDWLLDLSTHWHWANLPLALVLAVTLRGARAARGVALLAAAAPAGLPHAAPSLRRWSPVSCWPPRWLGPRRPRPLRRFWRA
jgi:hypothetical protein